MNDTDIKSLIRRGELASELELERASLATRFLRLQSKEDPKLEIIEDELSALIVKYESIHWSDVNLVTPAQIAESDLAEEQAAAEFKFFKDRRELILSKLKIHGLKQNDLAQILAHSKSYISELINGIRAFSSNDLIIIHKLLNIKLEELFFTEIPLETKVRINAILDRIPDISKRTMPKKRELVKE